MGDLFSRMAERALGSRIGIRPDFAPESTVGLIVTDQRVLSETTAASHVPRPSVETGAAPVVEPSALGADHDKPRKRTEHTPESTRPQPPFPAWARRSKLPAAQPVDAARHDSREQPRVSKRSDHPEEAHMSADAELRVHESVASVHPKMRPSVSSNRIEDVGYAAAQVSGISREMQQTVHVSIGRIEVRAMTPPASAPREHQRERRPAARLSLEEYLRQRNERRR